MAKEIPFDKSFASHEKAQYWSDKNELKPKNIAKFSNKKYIFDCNCGHEFTKILCDITGNNGWCPFCSSPPKKLCNNNNCNKCFEKSFASHEKAQYWSIENKLKPRDVFKNSNAKYIFNCSICNHQFQSKLSNINKLERWCPYCSNQKLCDNNDCKICFEKSFASHEKAQYWSNKNIDKPRNIFISTAKKFFFDCNKCNHLFIIPLSCISGQQHWCSYCGSQKLCDDNNCKICFEKSFESNPKSKYWSNENIEKPRYIFKATANKYKFKCENNHFFETSLNSINNSNTWCPYCVNKTEQKLYDNLQPIYNNLEQQYKVEWCKSDKTNKCYPFDFVLEDKKIIIELDGIQHFEQVSNWDSPEETHKRDLYKMKQANDNGYSIIRILQEDVFYDTYQWLEELKTNIKKIITENKVQNIFMCKYNEYDVFNYFIIEPKYSKYFNTNITNNEESSEEPSKNEIIKQKLIPKKPTKIKLL